MFITQQFELPALSESHRRVRLGPFRQLRVVRGLHLFFTRSDGTDGFISVAACPVTSPELPSLAAFDASPYQFFRQDEASGLPNYCRVPSERDIYLPLQVEFDRFSWILVSLYNADPLVSVLGSVCSACGLGSVRSGKRRGRSIERLA